MFRKIGIVGLGLIGGSLAKLIKQCNYPCEIFAVNRSSSAINAALEQGVICEGGHHVKDLPQDCDLVFVCSPINLVNSYIVEISKHCNDGCIITDVASIKSGVGSNISLKPNQLLIPGHPMAGTEKQGFEHSFADMFSQAKYIITASPCDRVNQFAKFLESLGFVVLFLTDTEHDQLMAFASHFPFLMAQLTVDVSKQVDTKKLKSVLGPGFRDTTRVASGSVQWALDIAKHNKDNLLMTLSHLKDSVSKLEKLLTEEDESSLSLQFMKSKDHRDSLFQGE